MAKIFVLGTAKKKKKANGCDNSHKAEKEKAVFQSSSATKGQCLLLSHRIQGETQSCLCPHRLVPCKLLVRLLPHPPLTVFFSFFFK